MLCLCVCLPACLSQVILSLPGTFDLVQLKSWTRCHLYVVCVSVCLSGYGNYIGGDYIGEDHIGREYRGRECRGRECRGGECRGGECRGGECRGGECRGGDCRGGDCRGGDCRGGDCRGQMSAGSTMYMGGLYKTGSTWGGLHKPGNTGYLCSGYAGTAYYQQF